MKALVVGGGIVGLVAARALALKGFVVTLLERKSEIADEGGIGIGLQSNAMTALAEIGVAQRCLDAGVPVAELATYAPDGTLLAVRPTERHAGSLWPGFTGIARPALHAILVAAAEDAGVTLRTGARVARAIERERAPSVLLESGEELPADLVVGADGVHSRLRAQLFPDRARTRMLGEGIWRGLVPGLRKQDVSFIFGGGVGTVGYTPLKNDLYVYVVDKAEHAPPRDATELAEAMAALLEPFGGFVPELRSRLSRRPGDVTYRRFETILLPSPWYRGRVVLIGDAAHAGPPTLAQGAAMGIEDAVVLADALATADDVRDGLDRFMRRRHARVRAIVEASLAISRAQMEPDGRATVMAAQQSASEVLAEPY